MTRLEEPALARGTTPPIPAPATKPPLPQDPAAAQRARTIARLKTYLFGVLIGVVLAALLFFMRWQARAMDRAAAEVQQQGLRGTP